MIFFSHFPTQIMEYRVGILPQPKVPWLFPYEKNAMDSKTLYGISPLYINILATILDFNFSYVVPQFGTYGMCTEKQTCNGLLGLLVDGQADFGAVFFELTAKTAGLMDVVQMPPSVGGWSFLIKKPQPSRNPGVIFTPFTFTGH